MIIGLDQVIGDLWASRTRVERGWKPSRPGHRGDRVVMEVEMAKGEGQRIAFNSRYLKDFLGAVSAEKLFLETTSQSRPGVFRTQDAGETPDDTIPPGATPSPGGAPAVAATAQAREHPIPA